MGEGDMQVLARSPSVGLLGATALPAFLATAELPLDRLACKNMSTLAARAVPNSSRMGEGLRDNGVDRDYCYSENRRSGRSLPSEDYFRA